MTKFGTPPAKISRAATFQKKQSDTPVGALLSIVTSLEPSILEKNKGNLPLDPMPVAPAVAPQQEKVASTVAVNGRPRAARGCSGLPFDCGVFTCIFADLLSRGYPLEFSQKHIDYSREKIAFAIMKREPIFYRLYCKCTWNHFIVLILDYLYRWWHYQET